MFFTNDIVLIDETRDGVNRKLEKWRDTLEPKGFIVRRSKTEYLECKFSEEEEQTLQDVVNEDMTTPKVGKFKYLGSLIQDNGEIDDDISHGEGRGRAMEMCIWSIV